MADFENAFVSVCKETKYFPFGARRTIGTPPPPLCIKTGEVAQMEKATPTLPPIGQGEG